MSVVAITGSHPRHAYFVDRLARAGILLGWVREQRERFVPEPPAELDTSTKALFRLHFERREAAEQQFFSTPSAPDVPIHDTTAATLNSDQVIGFIRGLAPRLVLSYGCHKLEPRLLSSVPATFWNTHGGLSPSYRGVITHFWPSYNLEPQMTGLTLHETTERLDGGAIVHQSGAPLHAGDGLHQLAGRTVKAYADTVPDLILRALAAEELPRGRVQKSSGRLWLSSHWRPEHLRVIYDAFDDRIVDRVLDGTLTGRVPKLSSVLTPAADRD